MTGAGTAPMTATVQGEKERARRPKAAGTRVSLDAEPVAMITPGLREKLTGPIMPKNPERALARPVTAIPLLSRVSGRSGFSISEMDWMELRSFTARAKKQKRKEMSTPGSNDRSVVKP